MEFKEALKIARKHYGIPKYERNCRLTYKGSRLKKAYNVHGTPEAGQHNMLCHYANIMIAKLQND